MKRKAQVSICVSHFPFPILHFALCTQRLHIRRNFGSGSLSGAGFQGSRQSWGSLRAISGKRRSEEMVPHFSPPSHAITLLHQIVGVRPGMYVTKLAVQGFSPYILYLPLQASYLLYLTKMKLYQLGGKRMPCWKAEFRVNQDVKAVSNLRKAEGREELLRTDPSLVEHARQELVHLLELSFFFTSPTNACNIISCISAINLEQNTYMVQCQQQLYRILTRR